MDYNCRATSKTTIDYSYMMSWDIETVPVATETSDLTNIESTVVQTVIRKARDFNYDSMKDTNNINFLMDILDNTAIYTVIADFMITAKASGTLSHVVKYCLRNNISPVTAAVKCGLLPDVLREIGHCGEVMTGIVTGGVIDEVQTKAKESGFSTEIVEDCHRWGVPLIQVAIKCGLLNEVLVEAVLTGNMARMLDGAIKGGLLDEVLTEAKKSGLLFFVVKYCLRNNIFSTVVLREAVRYKVLHSVLTEVAIMSYVCIAMRTNQDEYETALLINILKAMKQLKDKTLKAIVMVELLTEAKKYGIGLLSCAVKYCLRYDISPVTAAAQCGLLPDVLREAIDCGDVMKGPVTFGVIEKVQAKAKESGFSTEILEDCHRWGASLIQVAIKCGLLNEVLVEAVLTGNMARMLDGAIKGGLLDEVLTEAKKSGLLLYVVKYCLRNNIFPTVVLREAVRYDILRELLTGVTKLHSHSQIHFTYCSFKQEAADEEFLISVLKAVKQTEDNELRCTVMVKLLTQAMQSGILSLVVKYCFRNNLSPVTAAAKCGLLPNVLREAVHCKEVMTGPVTCGLVKKVQTKAKESGFSPEDVENCSKLGGSLIQVAMKCELLTEVLVEAVFTKNMTMFLDGVIECDLLDEVLTEAKKSGLLTDLKYYLRNNSSCLVALRRADRYDVLMETEESSFRKTKKCLIPFFYRYLLCALLFLLFRVPVVLVAKKIPTSHCSGEHRKCITDHMTLCSGDIERNPGPGFFFNDWLKEMFSLLVRIVHGIEGKRIPWKKYGRPDPSNSKFDRKGLQKLFDRTLLQAVETRIPVTHSEEFQILQAYIYNNLEPDLDRLEILVRTRKLMTSLKKNLEDFKSMPSEIQQLINSHLRRENLAFGMMNTNTEAVGDEANDDGGTPIMEREQIRDCKGAEIAQREEGPTVEGAETIEGAPIMQQQENETVEDKSRQENQMPYLPVTAPAVLNDQEETMSNDIENLHQIDENREVYLNIVSPFWSGIDLTDVDGLLDSLERCGVDLGDLGQLDESGAGQSVSASGDGGILQDPMKRILDQVESAGIRPEKDPNLLKLQMESDEGDTSESEEPPGPCRDNVTNSSTQHSDLDSDVNLELALLKKRHETLLLNFERFTGLKNSDTREYNLDENELTELRALSRKRRARSDLSGEEEVSKWSRFQ